MHFFNKHFFILLKKTFKIDHHWVSILFFINKNSKTYVGGLTIFKSSEGDVGIFLIVNFLPSDEPNPIDARERIDTESDGYGFERVGLTGSFNMIDEFQLQLSVGYPGFCWWCWKIN